MNKNFSVEFIQELLTILETCRDNETDNITIEIPKIDGSHTLIMDIQFRINEEEWSKEKS